MLLIAVFQLCLFPIYPAVIPATFHAVFKSFRTNRISESQILPYSACGLLYFHRRDKCGVNGLFFEKRVLQGGKGLSNRR